MTHIATGNITQGQQTQGRYVCALYTLQSQTWSYIGRPFTVAMLPPNIRKGVMAHMAQKGISNESHYTACTVGVRVKVDFICIVEFGSPWRPLICVPGAHEKASTLAMGLEETSYWL